MSSKPFHFKRFSLSQDRSTHKVGTDGVLLGSWVNISINDKHLLDVGTGCGLIALMLAQRTPDDCHIDAIDIAEHDVQQAIVNTAVSPWRDKISLWHTALQDFISPYQYDLIVSNPPFFLNSLPPPEQKRSRARHALTLSFDDLIDHTARLLSPQGRFALILPYAEAQHFSTQASRRSLFAIRKTAFRTRGHKPVERLLLEFSSAKKALEENEIVLYDDGENWSEAYRSLTQDFYLKS